MPIKRYEPLGENRFKPGDLVKRMMASHYTDNKPSDAIGVVLESTWPLAKVYFYDTANEEVWNQKVLEKINK
jgi:hypothetical protein